MNITHPCKQLVLDLVDELDPDAARLGAVNLVVFDEDRLVGYNTDWMGYRDGLAAGLPGASFERVVQIGCGGAGAATAYALLSQGTARLDLSDVDDDSRGGPRRPHARAFPDADRRDVSGRRTPRSHRPARAVSSTRRRWACSTTRASPSIVDLLRAEPGCRMSSTDRSRPSSSGRLPSAGHPVLDGGRMAVGQACASLRIITGIDARSRADGAALPCAHLR